MDELKRIVKICKANGITRFKNDDFEFEMAPQALGKSIGKMPAKPPEALPEAQSQKTPIPSTGMPTDDQFMFWSTDTMPDNDREVIPK